MNGEREEELEEERVERKIEEMEARAREEEERLAGEETAAEEMILAREEAEKEEEKVPTITYTGRLVERGNIIEIESGPPIRGRIGEEEISTRPGRDILIEHLSPDQIWYSADKKKVLMEGKGIVCSVSTREGGPTILRCGKREEIEVLG
jgi:hypothetical protein